MHEPWRIFAGPKMQQKCPYFLKRRRLRALKNQTNTRFLTLLLLQAQPVPYGNDVDANQKAVSIQSVFLFVFFFSLFRTITVLIISY